MCDFPRTSRNWLLADEFNLTFKSVSILYIVVSSLSVSLSCGGSSSNNNSYIVQSGTTTAPATPCVYDICPCSSDICRIRYDFTTHTLATQVKGSAHTGEDETDSKCIFQLNCRLNTILNYLCLFFRFCYWWLCDRSIFHCFAWRIWVSSHLWNQYWTAQ